MAHVRQQIRDAAVVLVTGLTTTGSNVFTSLFYDRESASLPLLIVYMGEEEDEAVAMFATRQLDRQVKLIIEAKAQAVDGLEDTLDTIVEEVEAAIAADRKFSGLARNTFLGSISAPEFFPDGSKPVGTVRIVFNVSYRTKDITPGTAE